MALINSVGVGRGDKSVGEFTYRYQRGRTIATRRIIENKSKSPAQVTQRKLFGVICDAFGGIPKYMMQAISVKSKYGSARNNYIKTNWDAFKTLTEKYPTWQNKWPKPLGELFGTLVENSISHPEYGLKMCVGDKDTITQEIENKGTEEEILKIKVLMREGIQDIKLKNVFGEESEEYHTFNYNWLVPYAKQYPKNWEKWKKFTIAAGNGIQFNYNDYSGIMEIQIKSKDYLKQITKLDVTTPERTVWAIPGIWINYKLVKLNKALYMEINP